MLEGGYASTNGRRFGPGGADEILAGRPLDDCITATEVARSSCCGVTNSSASPPLWLRPVKARWRCAAAGWRDAEAAGYRRPASWRRS